MFSSKHLLTQLLDTFNQCKDSGLPCQLHLETINGEQFYNILMKIPAGSPTRKSNFRRNGGKSPSTIRRDRARVEKWKLTKNQNQSTDVEASASPILKNTFHVFGLEILNTSQSLPSGNKKMADEEEQLERRSVEGGAGGKGRAELLAENENSSTKAKLYYQLQTLIGLCLSWTSNWMKDLTEDI